MDKGGGDAPSPDPQIGEAALKQAELGQQWLDFSKDAYAVSTKRQGELDTLTKQVQEMQLGTAADQMKWSREDRERYKSTFQPIEDEYIAQVKEYDSPAKQEAAAAEARGEVQSAAATSRATARREAEALGVNPTAGRYAGIEKAGELTTGLASAGAANAARTSVRDKALALKAGVMDFGRGLPTQSVAAATAGLNAGNSAVSSGQANQSLYQQSTGIMNTGYQGGMSGYQGQATTLTNKYGMELDAWKTQQESNASNISGIFGAIGTGVGLAFASDPRAKKNVKGTKKGEGLKAVKKMPIKKFDYKPGQGDGGKDHTGPMSDKFAKATGKPDNGVIRVQDAIGITMKAIQDLDDKVNKVEKSLKGKSKTKAKSKPAAARRSSQSPAKARMATAKPTVKAQTYGIRRA